MSKKSTTSLYVTEHYEPTIGSLAGQQNRTAYAFRGAVRCINTDWGIDSSLRQILKPPVESADLSMSNWSGFH